MEPVAELLERHLPALQAYVRLRAGPLVAAREGVADLVQSVCREVLEGQERFRFQGEQAFKSWLFTTALRKILEKDRYHRAARRDAGREAGPLQESGADGEPGVIAVYATFATPSQELAVREQMAAVEAAFARLSPPHQEVISQAKILGLSHEQIAAQMGITVAASRQLLRRAVLRLATLLEGSAAGPAGRAPAPEEP